MRSVRIWFKKTGSAKYISHLDLNRFVARALRRAQLPLWYTEGFNPRPHTAFSLPLPLGVESVCECVDIKIEGEIDDGEILRRISGASVPGIEFYSVTEPVLEPPKIGFAKYEFIFFPDDGDGTALKDSIASRLASGSLPAEKKTKKGTMRQLNLAEFISEARTDLCDGEVTLEAVLTAGNENNINPLLLARVLLEGTSYDYRLAKITRLKLYDAQHNEYR
ncbi:MAG: DUF2344 domain-containing protein [Clostridiales bacterium]|jgi:radical SAM-linked protein|nr:DUF2344 domain-containing protein [Clostridiales bacterium]